MSDTLNKLIDRSERAIELANEALSFVRNALQTDINMKNLVSRLISIFDTMVPSEHVLISDLPQNTYEFLDTLKTIIARILQDSDSIEKTKLESIDARIDTLIEELTSTLLPQHPQMVSRRKETPIQSRRRSNRTSCCGKY